MLLTVMSETNLSYRERSELFLDLYGNISIRDKSAEYLDQITIELSRLITEHRKNSSPLTDLIDFDNLKYKERDELEETIKAWHSKHEFDIEDLRDQRLRYHFKERYDARKNLVDWDFTFGISKIAKVVSSQQYKEFRMTGQAFEFRLDQGVSANRTMSSYIEGKKKKSGDSCLVRGFWGDISNSPYIPLGIYIENSEYKTKFYSEYNTQVPHNSQDIAEYTVIEFMSKLEELKPYEFDFPKLSFLKGSKDDKEEEKDEESKIEEVNEDEEEETEETKTEEVMEESKVEEVTDEKPRELLEGFKKLNISLKFITGDLTDLYIKSKYKGLFDLVVMSLKSDSVLTEEFKVLLNEGSKIYCESADNVVILKDEQRKQYREKLIAKVKEIKFEVLDSPWESYLLFDAKK